MELKLKIIDETITGELLDISYLDIEKYTFTVEELIRRRIYQEVEKYNNNRGDKFLGFIQPHEKEIQLNKPKTREYKKIDWNKQFKIAIQAFKNNQILILIDDRQVEKLDEMISFTPKTKVSFLKLVPLVGG